MVKVKNRYLFLVVFLLLFGGTIFYMRVEHWRFLDSIFFCVVTLATVGYGNMVPQTDLGKIFTIFYIIIGISIFLFFVNNLAKNYSERLRKRRLKKLKEDKSGHKKRLL